jgi:hypothetical protein
MPVVPSVAINLTTIMIAERIAKAVYTTAPGPQVQAAPTASAPPPVPEQPAVPLDAR